jgi:hypothetical protein
MRTLVGNSSVEVLIDNSEVEIPPIEYRLFDILQDGVQSTNGVPYTFIWLIPESREPFFAEIGKYYVVFRFYPRDGAASNTILKLSYEVTVT